MIAKFLASRFFLLLLTGASLLLLLLLTFDRVAQLVRMFRFPDYASSLEDSMTISTLLVGLGVVLEGRAVLLKKANQAHALVAGSLFHEVDEEFEYYGVFILILGVLLEIINQFIGFLNAHHYVGGMPLLVRLLMQGLALIALFVLARVVVIIFRMDTTSHQKK